MRGYGHRPGSRSGADAGVTSRNVQDLRLDVADGTTRLG
jgi:hypothetical protein